MDVRRLHESLVASAARRPDHVAVEELDGAAITYRDLDALSDRVRDRMASALCTTEAMMPCAWHWRMMS